MTDFWFFLSYARRDAIGGPYVEKFHKRLAQAIGRAAGLPSTVPDRQIGFLDTEGIEPGEAWPRELASAISTCKVFICLYSPAYFKSEYCGKELQAFLTRLSAVAPAGSPIDPAGHIVPIVWVRPDRLPRLPPVLQSLQHSPVDKEGSSGGGLYQMMKLKKYRDKCSNFFDELAATIVHRAGEHQLAPASALPDLRGTLSAFGRSGKGISASATYNDEDISGPRAAAFVFVAAREREMRERRKNLAAYGTEGGRDWRPYLTRAVGFVGQNLAAQEELFYEHIPIDGLLLERLRDAERGNKIVVLVVDPWTIELNAYKDRMLEYDRSSFCNTEVLIPWHLGDTETADAVRGLRENVRKTFSRNFVIGVLIRDSINSDEELERELIEAISRARARIMVFSGYVRPMNTSVALPRYSQVDVDTK